jgi:orotate phosphoribosyltransferase
VPQEPLSEADVLRLYEETGGLRRGHFLLSSGRHSDTFLQSAVVIQWPRIAEVLGRAMAKSYAGEVDVVIGPALGGVVIGHEVARALGVRMLFTERYEGRMTLRRSFALEQGERVLITENVVTTGGSALEALAAADGAGAKVVGVATIVDRRLPGDDFVLPLTALLRVHPTAFVATSCPLCVTGGAPEAPGSRRMK